MTNAVIIILGLVAIVGVGAAVYLATRPPPPPPAQEGGGLLRLAGTLAPLLLAS